MRAIGCVVAAAIDHAHASPDEAERARAFADGDKLAWNSAPQRGAMRMAPSRRTHSPLK